MIAQPPHDRKFVYGSVSLTMQRPNRYEFEIGEEIQNEIEKIMVDSEYLKEAPFFWIDISIRHGLKNDIEPSYQNINKKYGDLPLTIEIDVHETIGASFDEMKRIEKTAILISLIHAGKKYNLPIEKLEEEYKLIKMEL